MKLAEHLSYEDVTSQTNEELTALEEKLNKFLEPSEESQLESVKEVTQRERQMGRFADCLQEQTSCRVWDQPSMNFEILTRSAMSLNTP